MTEDEIRPGARLASEGGQYTGTVTRVARSRWRHRLLHFWISWDHDQPPGIEAGHLPGDEKCLHAVTGTAAGRPEPS